MTIGQFIQKVAAENIPLNYELVLGQTRTQPALACATDTISIAYFEEESGEVSLPEDAEQSANALVLWPED